MDHVDFDEEELARRKKESVEWRNKKRTSSTFTVLLTLFEIFITLVIMIGLFLLVAFFLFRVFKIDPNIQSVQVGFEISMVVIFFGSLVLGFFCYKALARWAIKKFQLEDKLTDDVLLHYKKQTKEEKEAQYKK